MPFYVFKNPKTEKTKEVFQAISAEHVYIDEDGLEWERVFTVPHASIDTSIDAFSENDFVKKTANKKYNVGDMWDISKELGEKRKKQEGKDPIGEKHQKDRAERNSKKKK